MVGQVKQEWAKDSSIQELLKQITQDPMSKPHHTWHDGILKFKGQILLPSPSKCKSKILVELHSTPTLGHDGFLKTYKWVARSFYWTGMKLDIKQFVVACDVC